MDHNKTLSKQNVLECVHKWGHGVIESILDPSCQIFSTPDVHGLIGYHMNRRCAVAYGDPVCAPQDREKLAHAFHEYCAKQRKNVIYLAASEDFAKWMHEEQSSGLISFGNELFFDPQCNPREAPGKKAAVLRRNLKHAEKGAVVVKEYQDHVPEIEIKIQDVATQWLKHRQGPQIYIAQSPLFHEKFGKRWFYAERDGQVIGCLALNRLEARGGWALDRVMTVPQASPGTSEFLVVSVMEILAKENCRYLTIGPTNGKSLETVAGFGKYTSLMIPFAFKASLKIFKLHRRGQYWDKFSPCSSPAFIVVKNASLGIHEIRGLMRTLNISFINRSKRKDLSK
ncbi:MAG: DUF2156 domain-containing protein [Verrucomicrobia bacterium]|nr:DUF2156 domain-containing protein [Verrucomicrobiota bacterium]MBS0645786.1 DUF2156 domain-containing protein [Verrucomicrobiota bacterium]